MTNRLCACTVFVWIAVPDLEPKAETSPEGRHFMNAQTAWGLGVYNLIVVRRGQRVLKVFSNYSLIKL